MNKSRARPCLCTMHFLFLVYMRAFRAISDRPAGIITLFTGTARLMTFYSEHNSPVRSFLIRNDRWYVITAKLHDDYSSGTRSQLWNRREVQLFAFLTQLCFVKLVLRTVRESVIVARYGRWKRSFKISRITISAIFLLNFPFPKYILKRYDFFF